MIKRSASITGAAGENIACQFLAQKGFRIITRNYRKPWGEIDIIAEKGNVIRFIEVKAMSVPTSAISRENPDYLPEEQIHPAKLRKIVRTAELYMAAMKDGREYQIDAVGVLMDTATRRARCRLFEQIIG
jgi:putative endonuclease